MRTLVITIAAGLSGAAMGQLCDPPFTQHTVGRALVTATAPLADLDGDGDLDIVTPMFDIPLMWFENRGGIPPVFDSHSMAGGPCLNYSWHKGAHDADIDADGDVDILCSPAGADGDLVWFENVGGAPPEFCERDVGNSGYCVGTGAHAADIDGDGALDLVGSINTPVEGYGVVWYESDGGSPPAFVDHIIVEGMEHYARNVWGADLDGDADGDVLAAFLSSDGQAQLWFENDGAQPPRFTMHVLSDASAYWITAADLDGDGDLDALSTNVGVRWFENVGGTPAEFVERFVGGASGVTITAVDFDRDGWTDMMTSGGHLLRNLGGSPPLFQPCDLGIGGLAATPGDLDLDGATDVVVRVGHEVFWLENPRCVADFNQDGVVDTRDFLAFLNAWNADDPEADIDWATSTPST